MVDLGLVAACPSRFIWGIEGEVNTLALYSFMNLWNVITENRGKCSKRHSAHVLLNTRLVILLGNSATWNICIIMQLCKTVHLSCSTHALYVIWSHIHASASLRLCFIPAEVLLLRDPHTQHCQRKRGAKNSLDMCVRVWGGEQNMPWGWIGLWMLGCFWNQTHTIPTWSIESCHDPTILHKTGSTAVELQILNSVFTIDALRLVVWNFSANAGNPWKPCWPPVIAELIVEVPWYEGILGKCWRLFCLPPKMR